MNPLMNQMMMGGGMKKQIPKRRVVKTRNRTLLYFGVSVIVIRFLLPAVMEPLSDYTEPISEWINEKIGSGD